MLTYFVTAYFKTTIDRFVTWLPTDVLAVSVAWVILIFAQLASGATAYDWRLYALSFANAFLVAAAAGQMHQKALSPPGVSATMKEDASNEP
ncbi:hypothetical protein [Paenibacillus terricola]|uniref:hypothetical protein n=1 Tax=Paenibacillus terricola TaxID=2763503 RepID=UPI001CD18D95|nr:hypothetical protein [Paenibacillus terricola]